MLTVLLATRNRAEILSGVLNAYCRLNSPASGWKLVVVDNGSSDRTPEILTSFAERLPLRSVRESKLGKNFALNSGLSHVEGDLVVLTDDDAFPTPDWLIHLRTAADDQPGFAMFGGVVLPRWEATPPTWVRWVNVGPVFTISDSGWRDGPIEPSEIFGPNMAIRSSVFQAGVRFDTTIGPRGSSYAMGSETELLLRLGRQGYKAWFAQRAVVEHYIRKEQLEMPWVLQRGVRFGRGQYRLYGLERNAGAALWRGVPLHLIRRALKQAMVAVSSLIFGRDEALFQARWRFNFFIGQIEEAFTMDRERRAHRVPSPTLTEATENSRRH
jgi:glycosyltransferase involved in cell wall biosynthesis